MTAQRIVSPVRLVAGRRFAGRSSQLQHLTCRSLYSSPRALRTSQPVYSPLRSFSTSMTNAHAVPASSSTVKASPTNVTPTERYQALVDSGVLRDDDHQRNIIKVLQNLHDELATYKQAPVPDPEEALKPKAKGLVSLTCCRRLRKSLA